MASSTTTAHERYKLPSVFHGDTVVHTTYTSDLNAGQRRVKVKTSWKREKELGSGAFGVVWRQREAGGKLRAVKIISKLHLNLREVEALIQLQDVGHHPACSVYPTANKWAASRSIHIVPGVVRGSARYPYRDGVYRARRFGPIH